MSASCGCDEVLQEMAATTQDTEIKVSDEPLSNPYGFEDIGLICPHGVRWFAIPTGVQVATWRKEGAS